MERRDIKIGEQLKSEEELELHGKNGDHKRSEKLKNTICLIIQVAEWSALATVIIALAYLAVTNPSQTAEKAITVIVGAVGGVFVSNFKKNAR